MRTYSLEEAAAEICGDSMKNPTLWLRRQIRANRFKAVKVGRHVRMTEKQIEEALAAMEIGGGLEVTSAHPVFKTLSLRGRVS
jgi:uncharacterized protein YgbK (DUF1537 family)